MGPRYCVLSLELVLFESNDGVKEQLKGILPYGNLVENYEGECHTSTDMHYPSHMHNVGHSKEVNVKAAC